MSLFWGCYTRKNKGRKTRDNNGGRGDDYNVSSPPPAVIPPGPPSSRAPSASGRFLNSAEDSGSSVGSTNQLPAPSPEPSLGLSRVSLTYDELAMATNNFSEANILGQGGVGVVYKGVLPNGKEIAVKSIRPGNSQGEREFVAEIETISRVVHKHLVPFVGYCITESYKLLVYKYFPNGTLESRLHGDAQPAMDWPTRLGIAIGSAKGLAYIQEDCYPMIIHRDIKPANIFLNNKLQAVVAGFGLARFLYPNTHLVAPVRGTFGYIAPEYASTGQFNEKSDVFSFGVLLLELISGRHAPDFTSHAYIEDSLVDWARPLLSKAIQDGNLDPLVDPRLEKNYNLEEMGAMVICAASCVRHSAKRRPQLSQVVRALEGNFALADLNDGVKSGFSSFYRSTNRK